MGVVWRAVDERLERSVAVKKVIGQHGLSEMDRADLHRRAMREAKIAARLQHPNAIVVFDITEHDGDPCLVMEYLPSHSLSELLAERRTFPVAEAARICEQVASALVAAHQAGIVHRDVKPGNILIDETGVAKLTDFGISRAHGDLTLTQTGLVGGTPAYIAPELARGADPTPTSDVFALGATLYHAIEGESPYGNNPNQLALLHTAASGKINPPRHAGAATAMLMAMLQPDPAERISMSQASERMSAIASGGGVPAPPPPIMPALPPQERKTPPWQRTGTPVAAATARVPRGTAMLDPVELPSTAPDHRSTPPPPAKPPMPSKGRSNTGLIAGIVAFLALVGIALVLLLDQEEQPGQGATPGTTTEAPTTTTTEPETTQPSDDEPIGLSPAGQLMIDYYSFPEGMDRSWEMLTPGAQEKFGDKEKFVEYWSKFDSVFARTARGVNEDDGSVTMTATVTEIEGGRERSEQRSVRIIRSGGKLVIDSDTR